MKSGNFPSIPLNGSTFMDDQSANNYIRNASGHDKGSANFTFHINASAADYIEIGGLQEAAAGTVNLIKATLTAERL